MTEKRRVLIVDDSALVRQVMTRILSKHPGLEVVGTAVDPYEAREKIIALQPDVMTVDIEMPRMDGLTFLSKLMRAHPMPVVVVSSLTAQGTETALEALRLGAVEVVGKPGGASGFGLERQGEEIAQTVFEASFARVTRSGSSLEAPQMKAHPSPSANHVQAKRFICLGASTGGTEALRKVFEGLPSNLPPIGVVQHILPGFTTAYAQRLDQLGTVRVKEAVDGEFLEPGWAYLAPSGHHFRIQHGRDGRFRASVLPGERIRNHLPSVDALFESSAEAGRRALGVLLTGMGDDGAQGLLAMRESGATTLGQDEATSVVYGMPKAAWKLGAVERQLPLDKVATEIAAWAAR